MEMAAHTALWWSRGQRIMATPVSAFTYFTGGRGRGRQVTAAADNTLYEQVADEIKCTDTVVVHIGDVVNTETLKGSRARPSL